MISQGNVATIVEEAVMCIGKSQRNAMKNSELF